MQLCSIHEKYISIHVIREIFNFPGDTIFYNKGMSGVVLRMELPLHYFSIYNKEIFVNINKYIDLDAWIDPLITFYSSNYLRLKHTLSKKLLCYDSYILSFILN